MIRSILIGLLAVATVATGYWGYTEHQEKNAILTHSENNYQRAFHQLTYRIDQLNEEIGSTLAMNSRRQLSPSLAEVWRITSEARGDVGQLPLALLPFNKTEEFLSNIGDFSYRVAVRDLDKEPLSDEEMKTLKKLYKNSGEIKQELRKVQSIALENNLRWMDVDLALASEKQPMDNTIIDGFQTVEKNVEGYTEVDWGPGKNNDLKKEEKLNKKLTGEKISANDAKDIAKRFLNLDSSANMKVNATNNDSEYAAYNVTVNGSGKDEAVYMDISKKGGHPLWMLNNRNVAENKIGLNDASKRAANYLKKHGFKNMVLTESNQFDHVGVFTFVHSQDNILVYPDSVIIKVALDDGSIVGYEGMKYLSSHKERKFPSEKISIDEARKSVNPNLKVQEERMSLIENELKQEVLCYEFLGTMGDDTYRIFINASNGEEEKVEKLKEAEPLYSS
ncbi:germination protein YpeB [Pueribacillus theae]|uniref:Germination protein YpeB n=1 Tax=Pueribacillus theae TaxID=2171751 RepID=A0A2U1K5Z2_9BACI|nr:germination protein YpeB [Pueribacillus theae]PWA12393.1 germination protein YpeB [Pueribacillus theae]